MRIALVMEYSTAARNEVVYETLKKVAEKNGHEVVNYGQRGPEDNRQTYIQNAFLIAAILNGKAADFVVTGCGTGEGAMVAANAMPGVVCGLVIDPADSFLFTQINNGNCMSLPFAKGWGWAAEVNLEYVFEKLFAKEPGGGYPASAAASEQANAARLNLLKTYSHPRFEDVLAAVDDEDLCACIRAGFAGERMDLFRRDCRVSSVLEAVERAVG
ncbi:MAG: RpiB/LacA/LacB family sugar-phosphate isomerase [Clostridia bacterium]|nr:RpiB/LacA/LacB family sugar-phosphate isomerase [Clostridia bacterium]